MRIGIFVCLMMRVADCLLPATDLDEDGMLLITRRAWGVEICLYICTLDVRHETKTWHCLFFSSIGFFFLLVRFSVLDLAL